MINERELQALADALESTRVERKSSLADPDRIRQAICAFANDLPGHGESGYVLVGVDDRGRPTGLAVTDRLVRTLADMRSDGNILPIPWLAVESMVLRGKAVAVVEVHPSDSPPVRFKGQVWVRVGSRRAIATVQEERQLTERRVAGARTFDRRPCGTATLDDLDLGMFTREYLPLQVDSSVLAENQRSVEEQLASLRFFDLKQGHPTYAGVLVLGRNPLDHIAGAYVQFVRFDGLTLADPVQDAKELGGNLPEQLRRLESLLPIQVHHRRVKRGALREVSAPDYPLQGLRELVLNAVMHRVYESTNAPVRINWFSDRVEIQSPGGLYGQVTAENYDRVSDYRNPVLAEAMKTLGYVERYGIGIARARAAFAKNGNPPAAFEFASTHVLVTVKSC